MVLEDMPASDDETTYRREGPQTSTLEAEQGGSSERGDYERSDRRRDDHERNGRERGNCENAAPAAAAEEIPPNKMPFRKGDGKGDGQGERPPAEDAVVGNDSAIGARKVAYLQCRLANP